MNRQLTGTVKAWISRPESINVAGLLSIEKASTALSRVVLAEHDMSGAGWVHVGTAEVTITFKDTGEIDAQQVAVLRGQLDEMRAEHQAKQMALQTRINNLLALEAA